MTKKQDRNNKGANGGKQKRKSSQGVLSAVVHRGELDSRSIEDFVDGLHYGSLQLKRLGTDPSLRRRPRAKRKKKTAKSKKKRSSKSSRRTNKALDKERRERERKRRQEMEAEAEEHMPEYVGNDYDQHQEPPYLNEEDDVQLEELPGDDGDEDFEDYEEGRQSLADDEDDFIDLDDEAVEYDEY